MKRLILIVGSLLLSSCAESGARTSETSLPAGHPDLPTSGVPEATTTLSGPVLETMQGAGYTYARIALGDAEIWAAGPASQLEVGQVVSIADGTLMENFRSQSLERTFEEIYFVGGFQTGADERSEIAEEAPTATSGAAIPSNAVPGSSGEAVEVLTGGGYTYVRVKVGDEHVWIAGPGINIEQGSTVGWSGATQMGEFYSPTLDRTFDSILFVSRIAGGG